MSHVTRTESPVAIKDKAALVSAAQKLGAEVLFDEEARGWSSLRHRGEIVLRHPESRYDVALNRVEGVYELNADLFGGGVEKVYGTKEHPYGKLVALYGAEVARKVALLRGYRVEQTMDQRGIVTQRVVVG